MKAHPSVVRACAPLSPIELRGIKMQLQGVQQGPVHYHIQSNCKMAHPSVPQGLETGVSDRILNEIKLQGVQ